MNQRLSLLLILLTISPVWADAPNLAPRPFSNPDRIRYDGHCLTIDGKDLFVFSGAFHYFRCPKELWPQRMATLKAMGLNTIETYVAWNVQEPQKPASLDDFSKVNLDDVEDFLNLAEKNGLYVIIRPGPYICAEWDGGGLPRWLLPMRPASAEPGKWFRSDDPTFVAWSRHWYKAVCPLIAKHQITHKAAGQPGVILFQLENEYDYSGQPTDVKMNYVKDLAEEAKADGIDVPFFTCWTADLRGSQDPVLHSIFDSCNFYPRWNVNEIAAKMNDLRAQQPDAPMMTTELQGGWFTNVSGQSESDPDHVIYGAGCTPAQIQNITLYAMQNGDTITSYYMAFGGTNFGQWAARNITTTYDYSCPVRECGGIDEKYLRVQAIGDMLKEHGASLARSDAVPLDVTGAPVEVSVAERRGVDGSSFFFIRTSQHDEIRKGTARVTETTGDKRTLVIPVDLEPFGSKVLYLPPGINDVSQGEWLPKPIGSIARPDHVPAVVPIQAEVVKADNGPDDSAYTSGDGIPDAAVNDSRYLFYRLSFDTNPGASQDYLDKLNLNFSIIHPDMLLLESGNKLLTPGVVSGDVNSFFGPSLFHAGHNEMTLLYECAGHSNGGGSMEDPSQITSVFIGPGGRPTPIAGWKMLAIKLKGKPTRRAEVAVKYDDSKWASADMSDAAQIPPTQSAVFRVTLDVSTMSPPPSSLDIGQLKGNSWVFINGKQVLAQDDQSLEARVDLTRDMTRKPMQIAVVVTAHTDNGGMANPSIIQADADHAASIPFKLSVATDSPGTTGQWFASDLDDSAWQSDPIGQTPTAAADPVSLLTWHRLKFALPAQDPHIWVPWCVRLNISGNGLLYLNGYPLGRYWNVGPQHDFFLPECWLNFGPGQHNVLAICLRPVHGPATIQSAEVRPYSAYAEVR